MEADVLEMMRGLPSKHLIKTIAYYQHGDHHYFMFPWAEHGNLWEFWMKGATASLSKPYIIWVFKQLKGLAVALEQLHGKSNCRHGDLKPENILCFGEDDRNDSIPAATVRMVITDVGLAKRHKEATRFREATQTTVSTMRYAGPEMEATPNAPLSRRFDIWSMGCIFLEFVTWVLYGPKELVRCTETFSETFYSIEKDKSGSTTVEVDPSVQRWIAYIRKDWRCSKDTALRRLVDLIVNKLLVVKLDGASPPSTPVIGTESQKIRATTDVEIIQPPASPQYRTYVLGMREELGDILAGLETGSVIPIGKPLNDPTSPLGPSHLTTKTKDGLLAPGLPTRVRPL